MIDTHYISQFAQYQWKHVFLQLPFVNGGVAAWHRLPVLNQSQDVRFLTQFEFDIVGAAGLAEFAAPEIAFWMLGHNLHFVGGVPNGTIILPTAGSVSQLGLATGTPIPFYRCEIVEATVNAYTHIYEKYQKEPNLFVAPATAIDFVVDDQLLTAGVNWVARVYLQWIEGTLKTDVEGIPYV